MSASAESRGWELGNPGFCSLYVHLFLVLLLSILHHDGAYVPLFNVTGTELLWGCHRRIQNVEEEIKAVGIASTCLYAGVLGLVLRTTGSPEFCRSHPDPISKSNSRALLDMVPPN